MKKFKVGILTPSDGRQYIHESLEPLNWRYQRELAATLEATGQVEVVQGRQILWNARVAQDEGRRLAEQGCDLTIMNYAIWCYPHLSAVATAFAPGPFLLFCNVHPSEPGMVGMLAAAGTLEQLGRPCTRVWGSISDTAVLGNVMAFVRAASAIGRLRGLTYGLFGGRPLGMYTAVANLDQWQKTFGIDVEHVEQQDLVEESRKVPAAHARQGRLWLEQHAREVRYDGAALTPEKLEIQVRSYHAFRRIIDARRLDFVGAKAHGDLTDTFVTLDIAEAFLNDPYDWDGPHAPIVASTEADMDGALTMQLFNHLTGKPVLFADVRHYDAEDRVWYLSNSGTHATYFAGGSDDAKVNMAEVSLLPECSYYPAGGASVHHFAAPGRVTLARLARRDGRYWLALAPARIVRFDRPIMLAKGATATPQWPIAFTRMDVDADRFLAEFPCNHIHGCYGDWSAEWMHIARLLGIEVRVLASAGAAVS